MRSATTLPLGLAPVGIARPALIETNDMDGLGRLMRSDPAAYAAYQHMMQAGLTTAYSDVAKRQKDRRSPA
jgi:hypothetical protein